MLDKLSLRSDIYGTIDCAPLDPDIERPVLFAPSQNNTISLQASGPFGSFRFHEIKNDNFCIRQNIFDLKEDIRLATDINTPSLGFHYTLKNNVRFLIPGFPEGTIQNHQYNMVYVPRINWEYIFDKDQECSCFGIHFTPEYLSQCNESFPLLSEFLDNVQHKTSTLISHAHLPATAEISGIIQSILFCKFTGMIKNLYLESKVPELLLLSLQQIPAKANFKKPQVILKNHEIEGIQFVKEYISSHLDNPGTLQDLAHLAGINEFKLKIGFKQLFGQTVFNFLVEERMYMARILLLEGRHSVYEIAIATGYKNLSNFTAAFKKKFGYAPTEVKQKHTQKC